MITSPAAAVCRNIASEISARSSASRWLQAVVGVRETTTTSPPTTTPYLKNRLVLNTLVRDSRDRRSFGIDGFRTAASLASVSMLPEEMPPRLKGEGGGACSEYCRPLYSVEASESSSSSNIEDIDEPSGLRSKSCTKATNRQILCLCL